MTVVSFCYTLLIPKFWVHKVEKWPKRYGVGISRWQFFIDFFHINKSEKNLRRKINDSSVKKSSTGSTTAISRYCQKNEHYFVVFSSNSPGPGWILSPIFWFKNKLLSLWRKSIPYNSTGTHFGHESIVFLIQKM